MTPAEKQLRCREISDRIREVCPDVSESHLLRDSVMMKIKHSDGKEYTITIHPAHNSKKETKNAV